ncbi:salt stress protein, Slr1339 family [Mastigocoleus testarum]|uniref:Uncharacterized protein n=1 Tax=Mastigocoleus testarum BC008 TaxID=371196 RepID=A0A0V7ZKW8_9CYAN|nr:hypothetical protein [Mastigocoleus testarum]KST65068.1 hypothetical protein BC008_19915 [Mastigocoleus testarum BC008]
MDPIEKLLAELKSEYNRTSPPKEENEDTDECQKLQSKTIRGTSKFANSPITKQSPISPDFNQSDPMDRLLSDVKADFEQKDLERDLQIQRELEQQRLEQEKFQAKQQELLQKRAQDWLSKLDTLSYEGLWFEKFAQGYSSKLAAAIEYLQANRENT